MNKFLAIILLSFSIYGNSQFDTLNREELLKILDENHIISRISTTPDGLKKIHFDYIDEDSIKIYTIVFIESTIYSVNESKIELGDDFYKVKDEITLECIPIEINSSYEVYRALINHRVIKIYFEYQTQKVINFEF